MDWKRGRDQGGPGKQKTDRQDAPLLLKLLVEDRFPRL
jgi:hypothetical protein